MLYNNISIKWLGHSGFQITYQDNIIYIDPYNLKKHYPPASIIISTHDHYDHCSIEDIESLVNNNTILITHPDCQSKISNLEIKDIKLLTPGKEISINNIKIKAVPAYNTNKKFHPRLNQWLGIILDINNTKIYHAGDTDKIPEMSSIKCDIALLPVSGTYVMTAEEAAQACNLINPKLAIPMHYNEIVGSIKDAEKFKSLSNCEVKILEIE